MKFTIFKKTTVQTLNISDYNEPKKIEKLKIFGVTIYESKTFDSESNTENYFFK